MKVTVWVCPTFGCGNYFGSESAGDLRESMTGLHGGPQYARSRCPSCWQRLGEHVDRIPVNFEDGVDGYRRDDHERRMQAAKP